jgi:hypothetical protein
MLNEHLFETSVIIPGINWKIILIIPSPLVGEGRGEGEYTIGTPTLTLPHQGGG